MRSTISVRSGAQEAGVHANWLETIRAGRRPICAVWSIGRIDAQTRGRQGAQDRVTIRETEREHKVLIGATAGLKRAEGCVRSAGALLEANPVIIGIDIPAKRSQGAIIDTSANASRRDTGLAGSLIADNLDALRVCKGATARGEPRCTLLAFRAILSPGITVWADITVEVWRGDEAAATGAGFSASGLGRAGRGGQVGGRRIALARGWCASARLGACRSRTAGEQNGGKSWEAAHWVRISQIVAMRRRRARTVTARTSNLDQKCLQWYDPMMPIPPGYEDVGICAIPT